MRYQVVIHETSRSILKEEPCMFNVINEKFKTKKEVKEFFINRYNHMPSGKRKIYIDTVDNKTVEIGFLHSYWNSDLSHNSKSWFQTDWIDISEITEKPVLLKNII